MTDFLMGFGLRDWLLVLGPVFVIGVLIQGYWRMRKNRIRAMNESAVSRDSDTEEFGQIDIGLFKAELPNGGARVRANVNAAKPKKTALNLDLEVPVLMNPVEPGDVLNSLEPINSPEPVNSPEPINSPEPVNSLEPINSPESINNPGSVGNTLNTNNLIDDEVSSDTETWDGPEGDVLLEPPRVKQQVRQRTRTGTAPGLAPSASANESPEMLVIVHVLAISEFFKGQKMLELLVEQEMSFGEMGIFHRFNADGKSLFSLLNAVEPGIFDLNTMGELETPGVSLFLSVHELANPVEAFDDMIGVAQTLANELGGELKDVTRSDMTSQTIEHCRLEIRQFHQKLD